MTEIITKGSLCSGTGGLDAAVPGELRWVAESNDAAALILKREHPETLNLGDITAPDFLPEPVDLITSGDPCQSMSAAGRQKASQDKRFLWPHVMETIDRLRPAHLFLENVQNLVSVPLLRGADDWRGQHGSVLKLRLDNLREAGYAVRWTVLGACAVGAPHHRHRWFLRAHRVGAGAPATERVPMKCGAPRTGGRVLLPTPTTADGMGGPGSSGRDGGLNLRTAVLQTLLPTPRATDGVNGGPSQRGRKGDLAMGSAVQEQHWGKFAAAVALWEQVTGRPVPDPTVPAPRGGRRLNPELSEWMMGYPLGYLTGELERNEALRCAGNGVVSLQAATAWDLLSPIDN
jgi:DNA (cytosine-5)-methyltransferase 1